MHLTETYKVRPDYGPRPAGKPDECFYCQRKVGDDHAEGCVMRKKAIVMRYSYEVTVLVPEDWDDHDAEFHRNESSSCADNTLDDLSKRLSVAVENSSPCWCGDFKAKYLRDAEPGDFQKFKLDPLS